MIHEQKKKKKKKKKRIYSNIYLVAHVINHGGVSCDEPLAYLIVLSDHVYARLSYSFFFLRPIKFLIFISLVAIDYSIGCGGSINQSFGQLQFGRKGSYGYLMCTWSIGNVGIEQAVALTSIQELYLSYYS